MSALLTIENVSVTLGATQALQDISLSVSAGEIVALLGPNGAGKTSLLRAAVGAIPAAGTIALQDAAPRSLTARARALRVAYLPQRPQSIWPISVEGLIALGRFAYGAGPDRLSPRDQSAVDAAVEACALAPLRRRRMDEISGGERARAQLARVLAQQAPLLLLDEPTAGLDPAQTLGVAGILRGQAAAGGAVLLATHDLTLAAGLADRVLLICAGRAVAAGTPTDALTPESLHVAYARKGRLERIGDASVAIFE